MVFEVSIYVICLGQCCRSQSQNHVMSGWFLYLTRTKQRKWCLTLCSRAQHSASSGDRTSDPWISKHFSKSMGTHNKYFCWKIRIVAIGTIPLILAWVKVRQVCSWIQDFEADFPQKVGLKSWIGQILIASLIFFSSILGNWPFKLVIGITVSVILLPAHPASFAHKFLFQQVAASPGKQ